MTTPSLGRRDACYPPLLRELHDPPARLYLRGVAVNALAAPAVAIVGARSCSAYGAQVARTLAHELAGAGVDGEAHRGALEAGGLTVAVLGCGIDRDYPAAHAGLARTIAETGLIVSEYEPGVEPAPRRFPARNRVIAGLALATVVVEARERSGALITADFALELGRDVFAVPGEITARLSVGTNHLLRQGAAPLLSADDVLLALGFEPKARPGPRGVSPEAARLLELLSDGAQGADDLGARSGEPASKVAAALVELELAGLASQDDGVYRAVAPP